MAEHVVRIRRAVRIGEDHRAQLSVGDGAVIVADTGGNRRAPTQMSVSSCCIDPLSATRWRTRAASISGT